MSTSSIPSVHRCARYTPGHSVHWVQARRSWIDKSISELPRGEIVSMEGEVIVVANEGPLLRYRNHDVDRLRLLIDQHGAEVALHESWHLLKVPIPEGFACICISRDEGVPLEPCVDPTAVPQPTSVEEFVDSTVKFGGANLDLSQLRRRQE